MFFGAENMIKTKVISLRGEATETSRRTKFWFTETPMKVNEKVNNVARGHLDDLKLQKPFYLFLWHHPLKTQLN